MPAVGSARRYAQAVFAIARDGDAFDRWREDLTALAEVFGVPEAQKFLSDPRASIEEKRRLVDEHLASLSPQARNLALLLVRRGRVHLASGIRQAYEEMVDAHLGVTPAEVTTAVPLEPDQQVRVEELLRRQTGRQLRLSVHVDPGIIGGLVTRVGDSVIDGSTRTHLRSLRDWLREGAA